MSYVLGFIFTCCFLFSQDALTQEIPSVVRNYDIRAYNPKELGVRDLAFEVRYEGLKETIEERLALSNLVDIYFQVYWLTPGRFEIKVAGLPDGFEELRAELRSMLRGRMELVIPEALTSRLRGYNLRTNSIDGGIQVVGKDPTHTKVINEIFLNFDNEGKLNRIRTQSPMGTNTTNIKMSPKSWSKNKWVIDQIVVTSVQGIQMTTITQNIDYKMEAGFGFPEKIALETTQKIVRPENDDGETFEASEETVIKFSNFRVNTGAARKVIISN